MSRAEIVLDGDVGPLRKALREGISAMNQFSKDSSKELDHATEPLSTMAKKFAGLAAVIGSGAIFKEAIDDTVKFTKEVNALGRVLGVNSAEATAWNVALGDIYQDADSLIGAVGKLTRVVAEDEENLNKLGIATRDANGHLREQGQIFLDVTGYLSKFTVGTDRNIEMAKIFGKSWSEVAPLLNLTADKIEEAKEKADSLGMTMTEQSQNRVKEYRAAMNDVGDVMDALKNTIGQAVMPVLTRMGEWFSAIGPAAVTVVRGAIYGLSTAFMGLQNAVVIVWEVINSFVYSVAEPIRSLGEALIHLAQGDFKAASEAMMGWPERIAQQWSGTMDRIAESSRRTANDIAALWGPGNATKGPSEGTGATTGKAKKDKADPSQMDALEALMAKQKQMLIEGGFIREYEAQQELAFWKSKLEMADLSGSDRLKIERKVAQLSYDIKKKSLEEGRQLDAEERKGAEALALSKLETEQAAAKALLDGDAINKQQYLALESDFEAQRYAIQSQALQERLMLLEQDPNSNLAEAARIKGELLQLEQSYQRTRLAAMKNAGADGGMGGFSSDIGNSFEQALQGVIARTRTFTQTLGSLFQGVRDAFIKNLITEPLAQYIGGLAKMLAVKLGFISAETTAQGTASEAIMGIKGIETTAVTSANAVQAGTGAAAAVAPTPFVGPMLALAAMAAVFAAVSALGSGGGSKTTTTSTKMPSAASGWDVPAGVNPMAQIHAEEMVLPAKYANGLRDLINGGQQESGMPGSGAQVIYNDHSGRLSQADIRRNARTIADELTRLGRNGYRPG